MRFVLPVLAGSTLLVYEPPNAENDPDTHLLFLETNTPAQRLSFRKFGIRTSYRVVSATRLCLDGRPVIYLASGSGATGASEVFVALVKRADGLHLFKLPEANQGRIDISELDPFTVKLWSADEQEESAFCGACQKHYVVTHFVLTETGFEAQHRSRMRKMFDPDPFIDKPLVIHRAPAPRNSSPSL